MGKVVHIDEYRPRQAVYVACMDCAQDWVAVFPLGTTKLECPSCHAMEGEPVQIHKPEWFTRFMSGANQQRRTMVCIAAKHMEGT